MKKGVAVGLAFALACAALFVVGHLLLSDNSSGGALSGVASDPPRPRAAEESGRLDVTRSGAAEVEPDVDDGAKPDRDRLVETLAPRDGPTLIFVESETGHPRPDAVVRLVQRDEVSEDEWDALGRFDNASDAEPLLLERGHAVELDSLATVMLPWKESEAMVFATAGERHLRRPIALDTSDRSVLRLVRREEITIVAVDSEGRRQREVPVVLQSLLRGDPWKLPPRVVFTQVTDRSGEALVAHGSDLLDQHLDGDGLASERAVVAALAFPCRDPCPTLVDPRLGCTRPVVLVTPPRATLELRAVDPSGTPLKFDVIVQAAASEAAPLVLPSQQAWTTTIGTGKTVTLTVEADLPIHLDAWSRDGGFRMGGMTVVAPARGTTSAIVLELKRNVARGRPGWLGYSVRVLAPDGSLLRLADVFWQIDGGFFPRSGRLKAGHTDADGLLDVEFKQSPALPAGARHEPVLHQLDVFDGIETLVSRGAQRHGNVVLSDPPASGPNDLPTVELREVPLLLAGRVLDQEGRGVPEVDITVGERLEIASSWTTRSGIGGAFSLRSASDLGRLEVWPSREGWYRVDEFDGLGRPRPIPAAVGQGDLEITLHRKGFVRGRLLVDPGISCSDLSVAVPPKGAPDVRSRLDPDGRFFMEGAPARRTIVVSSSLGAEDPIASIDGVLFEEGKETIDPRLDPIDLRGLLRQMELWVKSARDDSPIAFAKLYLTRNRGIKAAPRTTDPFGRAIVTTPTFDSALAIGDPGHLFKVLSFDRSFAEVKLQPAVAVRVKVEGPVDQLINGERFVLHLRLERASGGEVLQSLWRETPPPSPRRVADRTFEFQATVVGSYSLYWSCRIRGKEWQTVRAPVSVEVPATGDTVEVLEKFSDGDVESIVAAMDR